MNDLDTAFDHLRRLEIELCERAIEHEKSPDVRRVYKAAANALGRVRRAHIPGVAEDQGGVQ